MFFKFLLAVILTEALTEIVTKSEIFRPFRAKLFELSQNSNLFIWLHNLFDCGYCFSVWVGTIIAFLFFGDVSIVLPFLDQFLIGIALHRLSNILHNIIDRIHGI